MGIRFSISRKVITHLIKSSGYPSLKIENCREYLEPQAGLSGSMRNSNLIHSDLSASVPSTFLIFFTLETKGIGGGSSCAQKEAKQRQTLKTYSWPLSGLKFFNRSVITMLCIERKIAIYHCHQFLSISRIVSCMSNRDLT
jgi:hypothetical protein